MDVAARVDPELVAALQALPVGTLNWQDLPATRAARLEVLLQATAGIPDLPQVAKEDRLIPGRAGDPAVPVRLYRPTAASGSLPGFLWIHGGGYVLGSLVMNDFAMQHLVNEVGCVVVSVEYRLAPEHPFPAGTEDSYAALLWLYTNAAALGVDPTRIAIGGASAGGGLAAGLALLARDRGEVPVAFQLLVYPMIDDRSITPLARRSPTPASGTATRTAKAGGPTWAASRAARTPHLTRRRRGPPTWRACPRHTSLSARSISSWTRISRTRNGFCRLGYPSSCRSIPVPSTARRTWPRQRRSPSGWSPIGSRPSNGRCTRRVHSALAKATMSGSALNQGATGLS